jgi:hypothetical protein
MSSPTPKKSRAKPECPWSEHPSNAEALKAKYRAYYQANKDRIKANTKKRYYNFIRPLTVKSQVNTE